MRISRARWTGIQQLEWEYQRGKDPAAALPLKLVYWRRLLGTLRELGVAFDERTTVLDMGCGGTSILLALERGQLTGVDPLMDRYLARSAFLRAAPVTWLAGTAEEPRADGPFDVIFCINSLDHVRDLARSSRNLASHLADGGYLVLVLHVHLSRISRLYFSRLFRLVDPAHPHHLHREDPPALFPDLELLTAREIDHLWLDLLPRYNAQALPHARRPWRAFLGRAANPFRYPIAAAGLLGKPVLRRRAGDRPLMATTLYLLQKRPRAVRGRRQRR